MKISYLATIVLISGLFIGAGCNSIQTPQEPEKTVDEKPVVEELTVIEKIEKTDLYTKLTQDDITKLSECDKKNLGEINEVKKLNLYNNHFSVNIYSKPNKDKLDTDEARSMEKCGELGDIGVLEALPDQILFWCPLDCGYEIGEFFENETDESKACDKVLGEVLKYLKR